MSMEKSIRDAFGQEPGVKYRDKFGLVTEFAYGDPSGNGLLFYCHYLDLLRRQGIFQESDREEFRRIVASCERLPGLLRRNPEHTDQEGQDDYIGVTSVASWAAPEIARRILEYGKNHNWFYNNTRPGSVLHPSGKPNLSATFFRLPQLLAHFYHSCGERAPSILDCAFHKSMEWSANDAKEKHDNWILASHYVDTYYRLTNGQIGPACEKFLQRFREHYPLGLPEVLRAYFQDKGHPLGNVWG